MLSLPPSVRLFVAREPVDMRKAIDGLSGVVRDVLAEDPMSGHLFIFFNRRWDRVKILWWDRSGFWLLLKRLEEGRFKLPRAPRRRVGEDAAHHGERARARAGWDRSSWRAQAEEILSNERVKF